jgi:hypothetical protein
MDQIVSPSPFVRRKPLSRKVASENIDRTQEVAVAEGVSEGQLAANPLVALQHAHHMPPVGHPLWRKPVKAGEPVGVKAKTQYPAHPRSRAELAIPFWR